MRSKTTFWHKIRPGPAGSRVAARFIGDESGAMMIFGLFLLVIMLVAGGMAVDFMRHERERAMIQYTLDRSILAAAAFRQPLSPQEVVDDYFAKSGLRNVTVQVTPDEGFNYKRVTATAQGGINTFFVKSVGIDQMPVASGGTAEERLQKIEISLVLDVSGSMSNNSKLTNMKRAAKNFVDAVLTDDSDDLVSINIVPYNMQVNAGAAVLDQLNISGEHDYSNCVDFEAAAFSRRAITPNIPGTPGERLQRTGHFDPFYSYINHPNSDRDDNHPRLFMCPRSAASEVMLMSQDREALKARIENLRAGGNTSIDIGVKWGAYFLDPSFNRVMQGLSGPRVVDAAFAARPGSYTDAETIKYLIVMTDGINTTQYTLDDDYSSGLSDIWRDPDSQILSVRNSAGTPGNDGNNDGFNDDAVFWQSDLYTWNARNDGFDDPQWRNLPYNAQNAVRMTWPEVWAMMGTKYNAYYHHYEQNWRRSEYYHWRDDVVDSIGHGTKNARLQAICTEAKTKRDPDNHAERAIVIFAIGFEVTNSSATVMENCASSPSNFYRVNGNQIEDAFSSIAKTIQRLKLIN